MTDMKMKETLIRIDTIDSHQGKDQTVIINSSLKEIIIITIKTDIKNRTKMNPEIIIEMIMI
jgi:hypothetical protein